MLLETGLKSQKVIIWPGGYTKSEPGARSARVVSEMLDYLGHYRSGFSGKNETIVDAFRPGRYRSRF